MKLIQSLLRLLVSVSAAAICAASAVESENTAEISMQSLIEVIDRGGLKSLNSHLKEEGKWPRITTNYYASKHQIDEHKSWVELSERVIRMIQDLAKTAPSEDVDNLEAEADLLFSLGEKFWNAEGYRNKVLALLCSQLASHRCGKIAIHTKGEKTGPEFPKVFGANNTKDMLVLFISMMPEIEVFAESNLKDLFEKLPLDEKSWIETLIEIYKIEYNGSTVGQEFAESMSFTQINPLAITFYTEDLSSVVMQYGLSHVTNKSFLPLLATYLKNNGSMETLRNDPANVRIFSDVMKQEHNRFTLSPLTRDMVDPIAVAIFVKRIENSEEITHLLFGP